MPPEGIGSKKKGQEHQWSSYSEPCLGEFDLAEAAIWLSHLPNIAHP
jgi:hypothetical protein